jgi:hypothetical protein
MTCNTCENRHPILERGGGPWSDGTYTKVFLPVGPVLSPCPPFLWGRGMPGHSTDGVRDPGGVGVRLP